MPQHETEDFIHEYKGYWGCDSQCRIRIYRVSERLTLVIASELADNAGTSITNYAGELANQVYRYAGEPEGFIWVEHYPHDHSGFDESFDVVEFDVLHGKLDRPVWRRITRSQVEALIRRPIE